MKRSAQYFRFVGSMLLVLTLSAACIASPETSPKPTADFQVILPSSPPPPLADLETEAEPVETTVGVITLYWFGTRFGTNPDMGNIINGGESTLTRMPHGVAMTFNTVGLPPGEAVTIWWVIFNKPENCSDGECGFDDLLQLDESGAVMFDEAGIPLVNAAGREATAYSLLRADGKVVEEDGSAEFRGHLPVGDITEVYEGPGLLDPMNADIHLIARTHGQAIPGGTHLQLNSDWGGCPAQFKDPCADLQVAVHLSPARP